MKQNYIHIQEIIDEIKKKVLFYGEIQDRRVTPHHTSLLEDQLRWILHS